MHCDIICNLMAWMQDRGIACFPFFISKGPIRNYLHAPIGKKMYSVLYETHMMLSGLFQCLKLIHCHQSLLSAFTLNRYSNVRYCLHCRSHSIFSSLDHGGSCSIPYFILDLPFAVQLSILYVWVPLQVSKWLLVYHKSVSYANEPITWCATWPSYTLQQPRKQCFHLACEVGVEDKYRVAPK